MNATTNAASPITAPTSDTAQRPLQFVSWNVNGLRAILKKGNFLDFINTTHPDYICLQETKMKPGQATLDLPDYQEFWHSAERPGYSGVAIFVKNGLAAAPLPAPIDLAQPDQYGDINREGRLLALDCGQFFLVNAYVPNSKHELTRLRLRHEEWDPQFLAYLQELEQTKPVIVCGDFNAAHHPIDLARPQDNEQNAGYTPEEREGITNLLNAGFIDTFRALHPDTVQYSWWSMRGACRIRNIGWRIDYFLISHNLAGHLRSATIYDTVEGSDHAPIAIEMEF